MVFSDADGDGVRDAGDGPAGGVTVYVDLDRDGTRDAGEATTTTAPGGAYTLSGLAAGEYVVRAVAPFGNSVSGPAAPPDFYYAIDGTNNLLLKMDPLAGTTTTVGPLGTPIQGLVRTKDGRLFGITDDPDPDRFWSIDPRTGAATLIGQAGAELGRDITYDAATDTIYGVGDVGNSGFYQLGTFDRATGAFTPVAGAARISTSVLTGTPGLAFDPVKNRIIAYEFDGQIWEFTTGGAARVISTIPASLGRSLTYDGHRFVMKADSSSQPYLLEIDPDAGAWTTTNVIWPSGTITEGIAFAPSPGHAYVVSLADGQTVAGRDFGVAPNGSISGTVFTDRNENGVRDAGEVAAANTTVYLDLDGDGVRDSGEPTTFTGSDGSYAFTNVAPGKYTVRQVVPAGFRATTAGSGNGFYYATDVGIRRLMRIDEVTGDVTPITLVPPAGVAVPALHGLAYTGDGFLYAIEANLATDRLWIINPATGAMSVVGSTGQNLAWGMAGDPATGTLYGVAYIGGRVRLGTFNGAYGTREGGTFTPIGTGNGAAATGGTGALTGTGGIAFDPVNRRVVAYDFHDGEIYSFDLDGNATKISQTTANLSGGLAYDGSRFVMELRSGVASEMGTDGGLIALDPDAGTWTYLVHTSIPFFEESLEYVPGHDSSHVVLVSPASTVTGRDFGVARPNTVVVDLLADEDDGNYAAGDLSLREAVNIVATGGAVSFASALAGGTITLGGTQILLSRDVTIEGLGADRLTVSGNNASRVFQVLSGVTASIRGLTVTGGNAAGSVGGGIFSAGNLTVAESVVTRNSAQFGGGIDSSGILVLDRTVVAGNTADSSGGGLNVSGIVTITASTISENTAGSFGGGIYTFGTTTIANSTISGNSSGASGGGILSSDGSLVASNVTISGNSAAWTGGGLQQMSGGTARLRNATIFGNRADSDGAGGETGGGVSSLDNGTVTLHNTIVAGNVRGTGTGVASDVGRALAAGSSHDLIGDAASAGGLTNGSNGNIVGVDWHGVLDPVLRNNGGPTQTHALLRGPAVDAGSFAEALDPQGNPLVYDQRGVGFPRVVGTNVDIGAYEFSNRLPVVRDDAVSTTEDLLLSGSVLVDNGSGADSDPDGDPLTATAVNGSAADVGAWVTLASGALLRVNADGTFAFDPNGAYETLAAGQTATATFTYTVSDGFGGGSTATATVTVTGVNDPPVARNDDVSTTEDAATSGNLLADNGRGADSDIDGGPLSVVSVNGVAANVGTTITLASGALLRVNADGSFAYDPNGKFESLGTGDRTGDIFFYGLSDGRGGSSTAHALVLISGVNDRPAAAADAYEVDEDGRLVVSALPASVLVMKSDPGDWVGNGLSYRHTPSDATFTAEKNFGNGVTLSVIQHVDYGDWFYFNFVAPDRQLLTAGDYENAMRFPYEDPGHPGLSVFGDGRGDNSLTGHFTVHELVWGDGTDEVLSFAATFEQHGDGRVPALRGTINYNSAYGQTGGVLANDSDAEGVSLRAVLEVGPAHGTLSLTEFGTFEYTPFADFSGTDTFTYRASDGDLESDPVTVTITVRPVNDSPVAQDVSTATAVPDPVDGRVVGTDVDGDTLIYSLDTQATNGTAVVNADGTFTYTPRLGTGGVDTFTVLVSDGQGGTTTATVAVDVTPNESPVAAPDAVRIREDGSVVVSVLDNDSDPEGGPLTFLPPDGRSFGTWYTLASGARVMWNAGGTVTYETQGALAHLLPGETVAERITYRVADEAGNVSEGVLTVTVYGKGGVDLIGYLHGQWWVTYGGGLQTDRWAKWDDVAWDALRHGDVDADGYTDVFGFIDGKWQIGWAVAGGFNTYAGPVWANADWRDLAVRDVNGDGKSDLIGRAAGEWWVSLSIYDRETGPAYAKATRWSVWKDAAWDIVFVDDLNADGRSDLLGKIGGEWWAALSTGSGFGTASRWTKWADAEWDAIGTFDPDGDGRADLYGLTDGRWYVEHSTGSGFERSLRERWANVEWKDVRAGDFDGDGYDDLAARNNGVWYVSYSNLGAAPQTAKFATWADAGWKDVRAGDFDGDGRTDLIGRLDGEWWLSRAAGRGATATKQRWAKWADANWQAVTAGEVDGYGGPIPGVGQTTAANGSVQTASVSTTSTSSASTPLAVRLAESVAPVGASDDPLTLFWSQSEKDDAFADQLLAGV